MANVGGAAPQVEEDDDVFSTSTVGTLVEQIEALDATLGELGLDTVRLIYDPVYKVKVKDALKAANLPAFSLEAWAAPTPEAPALEAPAPEAPGSGSA